MFLAKRTHPRTGRIWTMFLAPALLLGLALIARWWLPSLAERIVARPSPLDGLDPAALAAEELEWRPEELVAVIGPLRDDRHRGATITSASFSGDGKRLATVGEDRRIVIWNVAEMRPELDVTVRSVVPTLATLSPDGQTLAAVLGNLVAIWDLRKDLSEKPTLGFPIGGTPRALAFTRDGKRIVCGSDKGQIQLGGLDGEAVALYGGGAGAEVKSLAATAEGRVVAAWTGNSVQCYEFAANRVKQRSAIAVPESSGVVFAPDLETFAAVDENNDVRWIDISTGKEWFKLHEAGTTVAFRSDGKMLAALTGGGTLRRVKLEGREADIQPGAPLKVAATGVSWAVFAPNLQSLVCASGETVQLWDLTGALPRVRGVLQGPKRPAHAVAFAPDGRTLAVGGLFPPNAGEPKGEAGGVQLWDLGSRPPALRTTLYGHKSEVTSLAYSFNGRLLVSGSDDKVVFWDLVGGPPRKRATLSGAKAPVAFAPNGKKVATANGGKIQLWDTDGELIREWTKYANPKDPSCRITALAFTPDGSTLATGTCGASADLWSIGGPTSSKPESLNDGQQEIGSALAISPDGKRLAMIDTDGTLRSWELADGKTKARGANDPGSFAESSPLPNAAIVFAPNSKYIAASTENGRVVVWNAATGNRLREWNVPGAVHGVAFAPDSRHLAIATGKGVVYLLRLAAPQSPAGASTRGAPRSGN